jgi:hypothetical protein
LLLNGPTVSGETFVDSAIPMQRFTVVT